MRINDDPENDNILPVATEWGVSPGLNCIFINVNHYRVYIYNLAGPGLMGEL